MAEIRITIPDNKAKLVLDAVTFYIKNEGSEKEVTKQIALAWLKKQLIAEAKRIVRNYQEQKYREEFNFLDPLD